MNRTAKITCPYCGTSLKSERGVRVGRQIFCPRCGAGFTVQADDGGPAHAEVAPAAPARRPGAVNGGRLMLAVGGVLLYLAGGSALGYYCFTQTGPPPETSRNTSDPQGGGAGENATPPPVPPRPTVVVAAAERLQIDNAVVQGVWYLKGSQRDDGAWGEGLPDGNSALVGFTALPGLTLLECGVPANDEQVTKAAKLVRDRAPGLTPEAPFVTYQLALSILFLDRLGDPKDDRLIQDLALRLMTGQRLDDGGWGYQCTTLDRQETPKLLKLLRDDTTTLDAWRKVALKGGEFDPGPSDNSNTQFAVLALWVARRHGVPVELPVALMENRFRTTQLPAGPDPSGNNVDLEGAWPYNPATGTANAVWPTMTPAGLLGLAVAHGVARGADDKQNFLDDPAIKKALAMLGREIDRPGEQRATDLYFLWSLERVGVLYDLSRIEGKDWYSWGRKRLLDSQQPDGHWEGGVYYDNNPVHDTCFALLFLKQANLAKDLTAKLQLLEKKK
jgi:hypothetical protein